jgi:hypothetical protein
MELGHSQGRRVNERGETVEAEFLMETGCRSPKPDPDRAGGLFRRE